MNILQVTTEQVRVDQGVYDFYVENLGAFDNKRLRYYMIQTNHYADIYHPEFQRFETFLQMCSVRNYPFVMINY